MSSKAQAEYNPFALPPPSSSNRGGWPSYGGPPTRQTVDLDGEPESFSARYYGTNTSNRAETAFPPRPQKYGQTKGSQNHQDRTSLSRFACHEYHVPLSSDGRILAENINLHGLKSRQEIGSNQSCSWDWAKKSTTGALHTETQRLLYITVAKRWFDAERQHLVDLTIVDNVQKGHVNSSRPMKWLHVEREDSDFDEFSAIALNTPDLSHSWKVVIASLLQRIRPVVRRTASSGQDQYSWPWLFRTDSQDLGVTGTEDVALTATSISFPYFGLGPPPSYETEKDQRRHPLMSLFQWYDRCDRYDSAREWDSDQVYPSMAEGKDAKDKFIYIPRVWSLVFDKTIITYGPISFRDIIGKSIRIVKEGSEKGTRPTTVRVIDTYSCDHNFGIGQCQTYFELCHTIEERCLKSSGLSFDTVDAILPNGVNLTGESWLAALESERSDVLTINLYRKKRSLPATASHQDVQQEFARPKTNRTSSSANNITHLPNNSVLSETRDSQSVGQNAFPELRDQGPPGSGLSDPKIEGDPESTVSIESISVSGLNNAPDAIEFTDAESEVVMLDSNQARLSSRDSENYGDLSENGSYVSLGVANERQVARGDHELHHARNDVGAAVDIPQWATLGTAGLDRDHVLFDLNKQVLEQRGILVLDTNQEIYPSVYVRPKREAKTASNPLEGDRSRMNHSQNRTPARVDMNDTSTTQEGAQKLHEERNKTHSAREARKAVNNYHKDSRGYKASGRPGPPPHVSTFNAQTLSNSSLLPGSDPPRDRIKRDIPEQPPSINVTSSSQPPRRSRGKSSLPQLNTLRPSKERSSFKIDIPPFLSWAADAETDFGRDNGTPETLHEYIQPILEAIHDTLKEQQLGRGAKLYRRAPELSKEEFEAAQPSLRSRNPSEKRAATTNPSETRNAAPQKQQEKGGSNTNAVELEDGVHQQLFKSYDDAIRNFYEVVKELLSFYLPLSSHHALIYKCWGVINLMLTSAQSGLRKDTSPQELNCARFWITRDVANDQRASCGPTPKESWSQCQGCRSGRLYRCLSDALEHVELWHFSMRDRAALSMEVLMPWVRDENQYRVDQRLDLYTSYIRDALAPICRVYESAKHVRAGVARDRGSKPSRYMLPSSLVKSLEQIIMLLVYTARSFQVIDRYCASFEEFIASEHRLIAERAQLQDVKKEMDSFGRNAVLFIEKAERDIMLMAHTNVDADTASYDTVGPEYVLATVLSNLSNRALDGIEQIDQIYASFTRKLHRDAMKHPRTRVLKDIWRISEEIQITSSVINSQRELLEDFRRILEPCTYRITTVRRATRFKTESRFLSLQVTMKDDQERKTANLLSKLEGISKHVARMLEIQQENNGNAIIAFTLVTIIFLPLSWATSYLGMNTADIRNSNHGQGLFWATALPLTALVMSLALIIVFKGEAIREYFLRRSSSKPREPKTFGIGLKPVQRQSTNLTSLTEAEAKRSGLRSRFWQTCRGTENYIDV